MVSLNAGDELYRTVESVLNQNYNDYEVIVKDGESTDGSLRKLDFIKNNKLKVFVEKDSGIYDAMNQATYYASGDYVIFINCGDKFYNETVLSECAKFIRDTSFCGTLDLSNVIFYGDCFTQNRGYNLIYPDVFDDYVCFTKTLCHQSTIYSMDLLKKRKFSLDYKIAADFEYYVYAYKHGVDLKHIPVVISVYQGNGTSETTKNRRLTLKESEKILKSNFTKKEYIKNYLKMQFRGVGIKRFIVKSSFLYGIYGKVATLYYKKR